MAAALAHKPREVVVGASTQPTAALSSLGDGHSSSGQPAGPGFTPAGGDRFPAWDSPLQGALFEHTQNIGLRDEAVVCPYRRLELAVDVVPPRPCVGVVEPLPQTVGPLEVELEPELAVDVPPRRSVWPPGAELHLVWQSTASRRFLQLEWRY